MSVSMLTVMLTPVAVPVTVLAQEDSAIQTGLKCGTELDPTSIDGTGASDCNTSTEAAPTIERIVKLVINIFSWVVGIIAVIMIIVGGLKYITSSGDSGNVTGAKNTILYAVVGLVVVALAQFVVRFVLERVSDNL